MIRRLLVPAIALIMLFSTNVSAETVKFKGYNFKAFVKKANRHFYKEFRQNNKTMLRVQPNEEYAIVVYNPLPVRVGVAVSIDGLNSVDGKRTTPGKAKKWIIAPNSSITVKGWQTDKNTLRKFVFTEDTAAYAQWRERREGKPYGKNMGVIGLAWFWNKQELHDALHPPEPFVSGASEMADDMGAPQMRGAAVPRSARAKKSSKAGTGMGTRQKHRVREIEFNANVGMYSVRKVMKIFYEFAQRPPEPLPFIDEERDTMRFAPEMP